MFESLIGIDLGGTTLSAGLIKNMKIEKAYTVNINADETKDAILNEIYEAIKNVNDGNVAGIGIGVPGILDDKKGIVYEVQNIPSWQEVHLKEEIEKQFNIPVYINNDANCFAVGVKYFSNGKKYRNLVGVTIGTGLGAGIIINNKLHSGIVCSAGEIGLIPYLDHNLEYYCSGQFFLNEFDVSGAELYERAVRNDKTALNIFNIFGHHLGKAIKTILYTIAPEVIVLGGSVSQSYSFFKKALEEEIQKIEYQNLLKRFKLFVNQIPNIAVLGAAALYLDAQKDSNNVLINLDKNN